MPAPNNKTWLAYGLLVIIAFALAACSASDAQLTAKAQYDLANTQITILRSTATVARARMQTTQDFTVTRVAGVEMAERYLRASLVALGTESTFIENSLTLAHGMSASTPQLGPPITVSRAAAPQARFTDGPVTVRTPAAMTRPGIAASSQPRLKNIVLASGKDENDCAIDQNPRFTPASTEIYVVAQAYSIPADAIISSSWRRMGAEVALASFQVENRINDNCIWLFIDQSDAAFVPGTWSVELRLDGQSLALVPFQIFEN